MDIQHKIIKDIDTISDCKTCHTDSHKTQKILFAGEGGKGITHSMPNIMLDKGLSCKGCHIFHEEKGGRIIKSETFTSRAKACESCHGKGFSRILQEWETSTEKKLGEIRAVYSKAHQEISQTKKSSKEKAEKLLEEAAFNIDIVEKGKSVHNMNYSQELLQTSYNTIVEALRIIGSSYKPEIAFITSKELPTQCSNCHAGIEEISGQPNRAVLSATIRIQPKTALDAIKSRRHFMKAALSTAMTSPKTSCPKLRPNARIAILAHRIRFIALIRINASIVMKKVMMRFSRNGRIRLKALLILSIVL
jgi:predicted translin family RNA/ssDNA-binding protein